MLTLNESAPIFDLPATGNKNINRQSLRGKNIVLYFYPKDCTPGCTRESRDFRDHQAEFTPLNTVILGISKDSVKSHEKFKQEEQLPFDLLADTDATVCHAYEVITDRNLYGRLFKGIERSTFVIDVAGKLVKEWRGVKVPGHVDEILEFVKALA